MNNKEKSIVTPIFDSVWLRDINNDTVDIIKHEKVRLNFMLFCYECFSNMILKEFTLLQLTQIYKGPIVRGCYHGLGLIMWLQENEMQIYEGYFYVNQIHGYGRMIYANGLIFEVINRLQQLE